jgi:adenylate kinase family enzyme
MKYQNIMIEGIDGAGKSTLVKEIANRFNLDIRVLGHQSGDQFGRYLAEYASHRHTVFERGHISEAVYSKLFGRPLPFTIGQQQLLDSVLRETSIIILADPDTALAAKRLVQRQHVHQVVRASQLAAGQRLFREAIRNHTHRSRLLTYRSANFEELESILKTLQQQLEGVV